MIDNDEFDGNMVDNEWNWWMELWSHFCVVEIWQSSGEDDKFAGESAKDLVFVEECVSNEIEFIVVDRIVDWDEQIVHQFHKLIVWNRHIPIHILLTNHSLNNNKT